MRDTTKKTVILGVNGDITAFKTAQLTSNLIKKGYDVEVIMTQNATEFITPLTFKSLTKHNMIVSTFEKVVDRSAKYIPITHRADTLAPVPATVNVIAKIVHGLADDMLTTTLLAADCPKMIYPAANTGMYENPVTQKNLEVAKALGYEPVEPEVGYPVCGDTGKGKFADITHIEECICRILETTGFFRGKRVLITAGSTREALDPVYSIPNHPSGKTGYEIARAARDMGAHVTLISDPVQLNVPHRACVVQAVSAQDMFKAVQQEYADCDIIIKAVAVGDYCVQKTEENKVKKQGELLEITSVKNPDTLAWLGEHRVSNQIIYGSVVETKHLLEHAAEKLNRKNCDMIVANNLHEQGADSQGDINVVIPLQKDHTEIPGLMSKHEVGVEILTRPVALSKERREA